MDWKLNPSLTTFRGEVNAFFPNRDKTSDGTIGDKAHQNTDSDHNVDPDGSVDAWDMDVDLRSGNDAENIEKLKLVFQKHPAARYWIHNRRIAHRNNGWERKYYSGANAHDKHVHWNSEPAHEKSTAPWGVKEALEDDMPTAKEVAQAVWGEKFPGLNDVKYPAETWLKNANKYAGESAKAEDVKSLMESVASIRAQVEKLAATPPGTVVITDEQLERVLRKVIGSVDTE